MTEKPKIRIKEYPVFMVKCDKCGKMDNIIGIGCINCDVEVVEEGEENE